MIGVALAFDVECSGRDRGTMRILIGPNFWPACGNTP
jgi:hypothetical protein